MAEKLTGIQWQTEEIQTYLLEFAEKEPLQSQDETPN